MNRASVMANPRGSGMTSGERTAAAAALFAAKGYSATTTRELSGALGITKGTFYHHFPSKEDLLLQICNESLARITAAVTEAADEAFAPLTRLELLIRQHVLTMLGDQALHKTMLTQMESLSAPNYQDVVAQRDAYSEIVRGLIHACQLEGTVKPSIDPRVLTLLLLNMLNWTIFWYRPDGEQTPSQIADAIIDTFLDGCRNRTGCTGLIRWEDAVEAEDALGVERLI